jgi:hypothetical protein
MGIGVPGKTTGKCDSSLHSDDKCQSARQCWPGPTQAAFPLSHGDPQLVHRSWYLFRGRGGPSLKVETGEERSPPISRLKGPNWNTAAGVHRRNPQGI